MLRMMRWVIIFVVWWLAPVRIFSNDLVYDLDLVECIEEPAGERFPVTFDFLFEGGYFETPSARMTEAGDMGFGGFYAPPYGIFNAMIQPFSHLEFSASYRIFRGVTDPVLSPHGHGDLSDRGLNLKFAIALPEDSDYCFPGLAVGAIDFIGTKRFRTFYGVVTQVWPHFGLEASLGWGTQRFGGGPSRGVFGGVAYFPFYGSENRWREGLSLAAEYDPIDYKNPDKEPHPDARFSRFPINFGVKYKLGKIIDLSASVIRGSEFACGGSMKYNLGFCDGIFPKIGDPMPYTSPRDKEPLGCYRPENVMIHHLCHMMEEQGFRLLEADIEEKCCEKVLWIHMINQRYREEEEMICRLKCLFAALAPPDITAVIVNLESYGLPCQQYLFPQEVLADVDQCITECELEMFVPRRDAFTPCCEDIREIFHQRLELWRARLGPRFETFQGSSKGKFKYDLGLRAFVDGFLPHNIYYECQVSYTLASTAKDVSDIDCFSPSQLPNVLTDYVNYRHRYNFSTDCAFLQKNWNMGHGWFAKLAGGYFQVNYAGGSAEVLLYPANWYLAFGVEGALLKKRRYTGLGFQDKLRKLKGCTPTYVPYTLLSQYFLNAYVDLPSLKMAGKVSVGQFLAYDRGVRLELVRYFESGLRIGGWMTFTNAGDKVHGENFYNRGIIIELPLDMFFRCSSRRVWNQGLAAWLRDAGAFIVPGVPLFDIINRERR